MRIFIDGDGCPVVQETVEIAQNYALEVLLYCDHAHVFHRDDLKVIQVDQGKDSVDFAILNAIKSGDVLISQDSGLSALALGKKAFVVNQNGFEYHEDNILQILNQRADGIKIRKKTNRFSHIAKRTHADDEKFMDTLVDCIERNLYGKGQIK